MYPWPVGSIMRGGCGRRSRFSILNYATMTGHLPFLVAAGSRAMQTFSEMSDLQINDLEIGIDGCSAPNFAVSLRNAALALARMCDPRQLAKPRAEACQSITAAMTAHPNMVGGPGRFDTRLMEVARGRIVAKGGAEGYQGLGLMPDALAPGSPGLGIAIKISDGDLKGRARPAIAIETLTQLNA